MTKSMLLDASHPEETRVVVLANNRLEQFDSESRDKKQLKGNIYLAKVTRVEPSLQAAFVDYGGNRHGFLPFSEIHPDYYRLPIADREALLAEEQAAQKREEDGEGEREGNGEDADEPDAESQAAAAGAQRRSHTPDEADANDPDVEQVETGSSVETLAGDEIEDAARRRAAFLGRYKIQEVIKRRQVILVQVVKEERGNKGAALTTYLSLAGRYCVLMPNTDKGGGISRKIANAKDRRRLKSVLSELNIPQGMAVIVRTAGSNRTKAEIKRDYDYLLRLWDEIRETTLQSTAPALIYEEANLIKRAVRDLYTRDMEQVLVEGEEGYKAAKAFMKSLMPSHAKKVKKYDDPKVPLFHQYRVESQIDNIHNPTVQLKSGGYIVMNQTEALVAIDVNSGKATKERHIEETALKTNLEAADEIARQLKLRDLAGLIVIDFIDMDAAKNNREVEQRLKDAMRQDRARIQLGRISPFGLLELSRQRLRPSLHETSTEVCKSCGGSGFVRSPESTALHVLRALEEEGIRAGAGEVLLTLPGEVALYTLNEKRNRLFEIEQRYGFRVRVQTDDHLVPPAYRLDRLSTVQPEPEAAEPAAGEEAEPAEAAESAEVEAPAEAKDEAGKSRKRGRRGGRKPRPEEAVEAAEAAEAAKGAEGTTTVEETSASAGESVEAGPSAEEDEDQKAKRRRRRGKRGGRRRSKRREEGEAPASAEAEGADEATVPADSEGPEGDSATDDLGPEEAVATAESEEARGEPRTPPVADGAEDAAADAAGEAAESPAAPAEAPAKPARRRGTRRKTTKVAAASAEASDAAQSEPAVADGEASPPPADGAPEGAAETKPKSRAKSTTRSTARKKATTSSTSGKSGARKTGARTRRTTKAKEKSEGAGEAETPQGESPDAEAKPAQPEPEPAQPEPEPATASAGEAAEPTGADELGETDTASERPKRRGWWQRLMS